MPSRRPIAAAALVYAIWTFLTWWFEGRIGTFLRPDAVADRAVYALLVNLGVGVAASILVLRATAPGAQQVAAAGLGPGRPGVLACTVAFAVGLAAYAALGAPTLEPVVLLNAYAQVFVVSAAEILVCFALPAAALAAVRPEAGWRWKVGVIAISAALFGVYHFAHSPPFDEVGTVAFLTVVGLVTGTVFVLSRDAYATVLFHNFLGTLGVTQALAAAGKLDGFGSPAWPLIGTAALTLAVALALDAGLLRRFRPVPGA
jgi:hypothetical protein